MKILARNFSTIPIVILASIVPFGCAQKNLPATDKSSLRLPVKKFAAFTLESPAFDNAKMLPSRFACGNEGVSPPLTLEHLPKNTKTVAFILEDPDAPQGTYTHWIMWNWPATKSEIPDTLPAQAKIENGAMQGITSNGKVGYNPPCPPSGTHRYYLKAYALDSALSLPSTSNKQELLAAMQGHIVGQGMLMATYHK